MSQRTSDEVLEMARQEIAARKAQETPEREVREMPWRYAFLGLVGALLLGLIAWPGMPLDRKMYSVVLGGGAQSDTVEGRGLDLPVCAR